MKNKSFVKTSVKYRAKKLDVVLRRLSGDTMTKEQRQCLQYALGCRRQYRLRLCKTDCDFKRAVSLGQASKDCGKRIRMLLSENCGMMAALVSSRPAGRRDMAELQRKRICAGSSMSTSARESCLLRRPSDPTRRTSSASTVMPFWTSPISQNYRSSWPVSSSGISATN